MDQPDILIADIETDGLLHQLTKVHCISIGTLDGTVTLYADHPDYVPIRHGLARLRTADRIVMHNGVGFDYPALAMIYGDDVMDRNLIWDSLIVSRLVQPTGRRHGLAAWGEQLGFEKGNHEDWSQFSHLMAVYCDQDVAVTTKVYQHLQTLIDYTLGSAIQLEHDFAWVIHLQEQHGFRLDVDAAQALAVEMRGEMVEIEAELQEIFPPITHERWSEKTGKRLKDRIEIFNPGSRKQIAERLIAKYNWKPKVFTPAGSPQIDEGVLSILKYDEAKALSRYFRCQKQLSQISEGDSGWLKCVSRRGYVHGKVNTIGTTTSRCSHFGPNMGQVDKKDPRMREVWKPDVGHLLVGIDADALELRMLASYLGLFDDGRYRDQLLLGDKDKGTDVHSMTGKLVQIESRNDVKRLTYAYLYGASDRKLSEILKDAGSPLKGKEARKRIGEGVVGLGKLSDIVVKKSQKGYILGVDKRRVPTKSEHSALNFLLQSCGAILMKKAVQVFHFDLCVSEGLVVNDRPVGFHYCANVHDEVQLSCEPQLAETLGKLFAKAITLAGERLGLRCPTSGSYDIGKSWLETH